VQGKPSRSINIEGAVVVGWSGNAAADVNLATEMGC
jgi:hypothetical protein